MPNAMRALCAIAVAALLAPFAADAQWMWTPQTGRWVNVSNLPKETPELQLEYARGLMLEGDYRKAYRETRKFDRYYGDSDLADQNQFLRGEIRMAQGQPYEAAREFQQMLASYPDTQLFDEALARQYAIGDQLYETGLRRIERRWTFYRQRPLRRAGEVYAMVVENQPFTPEAAEAQYKIGLTKHARKQYAEAAFEYRRVIEDYGASEWVNDASFGLARAYYEQSLPPEYDQTPSQLAIQAIDEFRNRFPGDERVPNLQEKRVEMRNKVGEQRLQTAQFYERRRDFQSAKIYYQIVADDFADTPAAAVAREWLEAHPQVNPTPYTHISAGAF